LEIGELVYVEEGKLENPEKNPLSKARTSNELDPRTCVWIWASIKPGSYWWRASKLTSAPSLLPKIKSHSYRPTGLQ